MTSVAIPSKIQKRPLNVKHLRQRLNNRAPSRIYEYVYSSNFDESRLSFGDIS